MGHIPVKKERKNEKEIKNSENVRSLGHFSAYVIAQKYYSDAADQCIHFNMVSATGSKGDLCLSFERDTTFYHSTS